MWILMFLYDIQRFNIIYSVASLSDSHKRYHFKQPTKFIICSTKIYVREALKLKKCGWVFEILQLNVPNKAKRIELATTILEFPCVIKYTGIDLFMLFIVMEIEIDLVSFQSKTLYLALVVGLKFLFIIQDCYRFLSQNTCKIKM